MQIADSFAKSDRTLKPWKPLIVGKCTLGNGIIPEFLKRGAKGFRPSAEMIPLSSVGFLAKLLSLPVASSSCALREVSILK